MLSEDLKDELLQVKLTYLNGYLRALSFINSYSIIGMQYKLFVYHFSNGNMEHSIQSHSHQLFGVYPNTWKIEFSKIKNWEELLKKEFTVNFDRKNSDYEKGKMPEFICDDYRKVFEEFISLLKESIITDNAVCYEMNVKTNGELYRIVGLDLVFEIDDTKIMFLQLKGLD